MTGPGRADTLGHRVARGRSRSGRALLMDVVRRHRSVFVVLTLLLVAGVTGCSPGAGERYKAGFSELPARCSDALKPADGAIKAFAGEAYSAVREAPDADRAAGDTSQSLTCAMKFGSSIQREPVKPYRTPMWRNATVSYFLSLYPIGVNDTRPNLANYVPGSTQPDSPRPTPVAGIGENAVTWEKTAKGDPPRISVMFSIDNLIVTVETWGKDWSGIPETFPVVDSPELRADLRAGTEAIAEAVAQQVPSALPRAMLTQPSLTSSTRTSTTAENPSVVWDPCQIPDDRLSAAGLDPNSLLRGDYDTKSAQCIWRGGWYRLRVSQTVAPFEGSIYENRTYVHPKPVTIGDRHAVQVRWDASTDWCVLAFEIPREANLPDKGGQTLRFEAARTDDHPPADLCTELTRVTTLLSPSLPPTT
ncbi:DUF3558 family protein [Nocardia sp. NPDC057030]|uniref:DUF3558 family protein n=1 Tax=Nocardia sp. NPDC057030 TaxID=3346005 RepID=UPI0036293023